MNVQRFNKYLLENLCHYIGYSLILALSFEVLIGNFLYTYNIACELIPYWVLILAMEAAALVSCACGQIGRSGRDLDRRERKNEKRQMTSISTVREGSR